MMLLESAEVSKDDKDSGLDILVFGADVNSDEARTQRSKQPAFMYYINSDGSCTLMFS